MAAIWSCDFDHLYKLSFPLPKDAPHKVALTGVSEKMFEYYCHIHVYCPGAGADDPLGQKYFYKHKFSVCLLIPSQFLPLNDIFLFFPFKCMGDLR